MFCEGLLMRVWPASIHEQAIVLWCWVNKFALSYRPSALLRIQRGGAGTSGRWTPIARASTNQSLLQALLFDGFDMVLNVRALQAGTRVEEFGVLVRWLIWNRCCLVFNNVEILGAWVASIGASSPICLWHFINRVVQICICKHGCLASVDLFLVLLLLLRIWSATVVEI